LLKNKSSLEEVERALKSAPIAVPGLHRLVEGVRGAHAWMEKLGKLDPKGETVDLRTLESLVSEGQRLPLTLPGLKVSDPALQHAQLLSSLDYREVAKNDRLGRLCKPNTMVTFKFQKPLQRFSWLITSLIFSVIKKRKCTILN
jgi:hypothetical protein